MDPPEDPIVVRDRVNSILAKVASIEPFPISEIRRITTELLDSPRGEPDKANHFFKVYPDFAKKYPMLFDTCCRRDVDRGRLNYMLTMIESVQNNTISKDKADVAVGQALYNKFINIKEK